jgi:ribosomal protein L37AE/L43A
MYYTYIHSSPEGKVFYIGKGANDRAFSFNDRSQAWKRAVMQHSGIKIDILSHWKTEDEAYDHEKVLIACFNDMGYGLVNKTNGGKGAYGVKMSVESLKKRSEKLKGYVHKIVTCPHCKKIGGETSMKRWHFDKCSGNKLYKARASHNGKRVDLGRFSTQEEANQKVLNFYSEANKPVPREFYIRKGIK